ncbi:MAG: hypothetical protein M3Q71_13825 [Chloroflexota bacterium]|nr:hypothetical protein [Chloroflexota bacterium]
MASQGLPLAELHLIIDEGRKRWADPLWCRRTLAAAIRRESDKAAFLQGLDRPTAGTEQRIARIREDHRLAVLETAR